MKTINIGWKHRIDNKSPFEGMGLIGKKKILLDANKEYMNVEEVKKDIIPEYSTDDNKIFFTNSITSLVIVKKDKPDFYVFSFKDYFDEPCDFWNFCEYNVKDKSNQIIIYLYSTKYKSLDPSCNQILQKKNF